MQNNTRIALTRFKQDVTDRRGRMRLDPPAPARNTVGRAILLYRHKSIVHNEAASSQRPYQPSSRVFTSAVSWAEPETQTSLKTEAITSQTDTPDTGLEVAAHNPSVLILFLDVTQHDFVNTIHRLPCLLAIFQSTREISSL